MKSDDEASSTKLESKTILFMLVVISLALVWILLPFYGTIMWGAIIALIFSPLYRWLLPRLKQRRTSVELLTLLIVLLIVIFPFLSDAALISSCDLVCVVAQNDAQEWGKVTQTEWCGVLAIGAVTRD